MRTRGSSCSSRATNASPAGSARSASTAASARRSASSRAKATVTSPCCWSTASPRRSCRHGRRSRSSKRSAATAPRRDIRRADRRLMRARVALLVAWLAALAVLAAFALHSLRIGTDLRSFMPPPRTPDQKLLMEQIGEGPGTRLLLLSIDGAPEARLAGLSRGLVAKLRADAHFEQAINGAFDVSALDDKLLPYRWLLSPTLDTHALDAGYLADQLGQRVEDLASPAATLLKPLLPRDPTLEVLALAQRWSPPKAPLVRDGVWFSSDGAALLLAQTRGA